MVVKINKTIVLIFIFCSGLISCSEPENKNGNIPLTTKELKEPLIKSNKYLTRSEKEDIDDFVKRYGWELESTGTGLLYQIDERGSGKKIQYGNIVKANYQVKLLSGEKVYDSEQDGILEFKVGKGGVPAGIEEGIIMLRLHDRAKFILPSHLAYGLLGDSYRIPPRSVLVYEMEIVEIK